MTSEYGNLKVFVEKHEHKARNVLVTGTTGFLGGHYLFWRSHLPGKIFVLVRADTLDHGWERVFQSVKKAASNYDMPLLDEAVLRDKITCILGDLSKPDCGISPSDQDLMTESGVTEIWHVAANMSFLPKDRDNLIKTNVLGSKALMAVGKAFGIERFIYISTGYTSGSTNGIIKETLHPSDTKFENCYEESKCLAETAIAEYCEGNNLEWNILRPTMVMGPIANMESGGTSFGAYGMGRSLNTHRELLAKMSQKIRVLVTDTAIGNMIAVDQVVYDMLYVESINFGDQNIYHLSNTFNETMRNCIAAVEKGIGTDALHLVNERDSDPTSFERTFDEANKFAICYFRGEKEFIRSLPEHPVKFDAPMLAIGMKNYRKELMSAEARSSFESLNVKSWDGLDLDVYTHGDDSKPPIIFVNAYAMPVDFMGPISKRLGNDFKFITWDSRWVPNIDHEFDLELCNSLTHAKDLISIMDALGIDQCPIVGWSSGAQVCLRAMNEFPDRIENGILLNGGVSLRPVEETDYQKTLRSLFPKMGASRRVANLYCDLIYGDTTKVGSNDQGAVGSMITLIDPELMDMTSAPFQNPESLFRYANMMYRNFEEREDAYTTGVETPVLVYGSECDEIVHPDLVIALSAKLKNSTYYIDKKATHFAHYRDEKVAAMIIDYLSGNLTESKRSA